MFTIYIYNLVYCRLVCSFFFLMIRRPPISTLTDTLFPYTTLFRSTLVLVDGRRWVSSLGGSVDLNTIPSSIVERIEVLKDRSEEHTSELQSLMRISYAVLRLKKKKQGQENIRHKAIHNALNKLQQNVTDNT